MAPASPAADAPDSETAIEVVVTGTRAAEDPRRAVVVTDVMSHSAIMESGARNASEALSQQPALQIEASDQGYGILLRGLDPEYTLVLLDGDRMIGRVRGAIDLSRIGVERIERIEIVRGPASALYGSDALAGVVNIIGRDSDSPLAAEAMASGGGTPGEGDIGDVSGWISGEPHASLRIEGGGGYHRASPVADPDDNLYTRRSRRKQWSSYGGVTYAPRRAHRVRLTGEYDDLLLNGVDDGAGNAVFDRTQWRQQMLGGLSYRYRPNVRWGWDTRYRGSFFREQYLSDQRGSAALDTREDNREIAHQVTSMLVFRASSEHQTTLGAEQLIQQPRADRLSDPRDRYRTSPFAQHEYRPWQRPDARGRAACDRQLGIVPGVRSDFDSQFGTQVSPKLALRYDPLPCLTVRASYGRGFRAPTFQQLYLRFENPTVGYVVEGNPDLEAEHSHGIDLSVNWAPSSKLELFAAFFRNDLQDMITNVTVGGGAAGTLFTYDNIATAWTMGAESRMVLDPVRWLAMTLSYTFLATHDGEQDRELEGRAKHRPTLSLRVLHPRWGTSAVLRGSSLIGRVYYTTPEGEAVDRPRRPAPLNAADVRVAQRFGEHVELFAGSQNLLDAGDAYDFLRPRTFYAGLRGRY